LPEIQGRQRSWHDLARRLRFESTRDKKGWIIVGLPDKNPYDNMTQETVLSRRLGGLLPRTTLFS
jgi:hypothetical protein